MAMAIGICILLALGCGVAWLCSKLDAEDWE